MADSRLLVDDALAPLLRAAGLLELDLIFARDDMQVVKARLAERQTFRVRAGECSFYVKRYLNPESDSLLAGLFAQRFSSPAAREWHVLQRLEQLGVPAPHAAACMEEVVGGDLRRAAIITVGLPAEISLQKVIQTQDLTPARRHGFAIELGRLLRRMHEGGVNHRDFYLVHIRVGVDDTLYVTDLNRADIRKRVTRRWRVKDVAALEHSAPANVTRTDKARLWRAYAGGHLREHRDLIAAVLRKAARMSAHTRKRIAEGEANFHVVE